MQRFYTPHISFDKEIEITQKDLYHQLTRVLRIRNGQEVIFFNGKNHEDFIYVVKYIDKQKVICEFQKLQKTHTEVDVKLHLYQALPHKLEKLEYIIEKGVELGYSSFTFFPSHRSQKFLLSEAKQIRLVKIAKEALEQCGGSIFPDIHVLEKNILTQDFTLTSQVGIYCHTSSEYTQSPASFSLYNQKQVDIFVGPEGGFCDQEVESMRAAGCVGICFGERILRCETVSGALAFFLIHKGER